LSLCGGPEDGGAVRFDMDYSPVSALGYPKEPNSLLDDRFDDEDLDDLASQRGMPPEKYSALVAAGKVVSLLIRQEGMEINLNRSVYDSAIILPQICRSGGNPRSFVHLSILGFAFLFLNFALQVVVLYMIDYEEQMMQDYSGQMKLCDFGANVETCPGGANCIGPSGTNYQNAGRMYSFQVWQTRTFIRDMLLSLFPNKAEEIMSNVDPGEYGVENYWVRFVCIFVFMMTVLSDITSTVDLMTILWHVPSSTSENWMEFHVPDWADKAIVKEFKDCSDIEFVKFKFAGMSRVWKLINCILIVIPKLLIFRMAASCGVFFLMETAGIQDVIVNVTALSFILNLDEMIFSLFSHKAVQHIIEHMEPFKTRPGVQEAENHSMKRSVEEVERDKRRTCFECVFLPWRSVAVVLLSAVFIAEYYWKNCKRNARGGWVSIDGHTPLRPAYNAWALILPWVEGAESGDRFWHWTGDESI